MLMLVLMFAIEYMVAWFGRKVNATRRETFRSEARLPQMQTSPDAVINLI